MFANIVETVTDDMAIDPKVPMETDVQELVPELPEFTQKIPVRLDSMVRLTLLTDTELNKWMHQAKGDKWYYLQVRTVKRSRGHPDRQAKGDVSYTFDSGFSSDDDFLVQPCKWSKPRIKNKHIPLGGPTAGHIAAQHMIDKQWAHIAATALLDLNRGQDGAASENDTGDDKDGKSTSLSGGKSSAMVQIDETTNHAHSSNCSTCSSSSSSSTERSDADNAKDDTNSKQEKNNAKQDPNTGYDDNDNMPLSELKAKLGKRKAYSKPWYLNW